MKALDDFQFLLASQSPRTRSLSATAWQRREPLSGANWNSVFR